jgi:hypothetical protein
MMPPEIEFRSVGTRLRPARLAILVDLKDPDWMHTCLEVIEWTTRVWGGWYSIIVPTDGFTINDCFFEILEYFDPDYIYVYQNRERYEPSISSGLFCELVERCVPFFDPAAMAFPVITKETPIAFPLTDVSYLTSFLPGHLWQPLNVLANHIEMEGSPAEKLFVYSLLGKMGQTLQSSLADKGVMIPLLQYGRDKLDKLFQRIWQTAEDADMRTARFLSLLNCQLIGVPENDEGPTNLVVIGQTIHDFCMFHNLSRIHNSVYWLPVVPQAEPSSIYHLPLPGVLAYHLHANTKGKIVLASFSLPSNEVELAGQILDNALTFASSDGNPVLSKRIEYSNQPLAKIGMPLRLYERTGTGRWYKEQFYKGESANAINTPKPQTFTEVPSHGHYWITEVYVSGYETPRRVGLAQHIIQQAGYGVEYVRTVRTGYAYLCPNCASWNQDVDSLLVRPTIHVPEPMALFQSLFTKANYKIALSDKGNYQKECTSKFDNLEGIGEFFFYEPCRKFLDLFMRPKSDAKRSDNAGTPSNARREMFLNTDSRWYLGFESIEEIFAEQSSEMVDWLIRIGVIYRGLILKCDACRNATWYSLENLGSAFTCPRCGRAQGIQSHHWMNGKEPGWYYKLDEIMYQGHEHNMHVPIRTLALLQQASRSFLYIPEIKITDDKSSGQTMEIDVCCCRDGELIIGEAKVPDNLGTTREAKSSIHKYISVAQRIGAKRVVFSTFSDSWTAKTLQLIEEACSSEHARGIRIDTFTKATLLRFP